MNRIGLVQHGLIVAVAALFGSGIAGAQQASTAADQLPTADAILEKFIEVTGGRAAYLRLNNILSRGTFDVRGTRMRGTYTVYEAQPDKTRSILDVEGAERMEEGTLGGVAWEKSTTGGPRIKEGEEKAYALREATFNSCLYWKKLYVRVETTGTEMVAGRPCYVVRLTPAQGQPILDFYDVESGLRTKSIISLKTPSEDLLTETYYEDYRPSNMRVSFPFKLLHRLKKEETSVELVSVRCNVDIAWNRFDLPPDIKALLARSRR